MSFKINKIKKKPLIFCSPFIWKKIYLFKKSFVFKVGEKKIFGRSSVVPKIFTNMDISIYSGKRWHSRFITRWMIGFKFGEFTWNRRIALYKAKQLKKKKKIKK
jgi:ribosomal protein S19